MLMNSVGQEFHQGTVECLIAAPLSGVSHGRLRLGIRIFWRLVPSSVLCWLCPRLQLVLLAGTLIYSRKLGESSLIA